MGTWSDWEKFTTERDISNLITYKYGDFGINLDEAFCQEILKTYKSTSIFSTFSGGTTAGMEGYYLGYKHRTFGEGIMISRKVIYFYIINDETITSRKIMDLN